MSVGSCMIMFVPALTPVACGALATALGWRFVFVAPAAALAGLLVLAALSAGEMAASKLAPVDAGTTLREACSLLARHKIKKVPGTDGSGGVVGAANRSDVLRCAMGRFLEAEQLKD